MPIEPHPVMRRQSLLFIQSDGTVHTEKSYWTKRTSVWVQTNQSESGEYNLISVLFNKNSKRFLCMQLLQMRPSEMRINEDSFVFLIDLSGDWRLSAQLTTPPQALLYNISLIFAGFQEPCSTEKCLSLVSEIPEINCTNIQNLAGTFGPVVSLRRPVWNFYLFLIAEFLILCGIKGPN